MSPTTSLFFTGVGRVEFGETALPEAGPDDVVIKTSLSCISPGTEMRCLAGEQDASRSP